MPGSKKKNLNLDFVSTPTPKPRASRRIWGSTRLLSRCTSHQETLGVYSSQERMCSSPFVTKVLVWSSPSQGQATHHGQHPLTPVCACMRVHECACKYMHSYPWERFLQVNHGDFAVPRFRKPACPSQRMNTSRLEPPGLRGHCQGRKPSPKATPREARLGRRPGSPWGLGDMEGGRSPGWFETELDSSSSLTGCFSVIRVADSNFHFRTPLVSPSVPLETAIFFTLEIKAVYSFQNCAVGPSAWLRTFTSFVQQLSCLIWKRGGLGDRFASIFVSKECLLEIKTQSS